MVTVGAKELCKVNDGKLEGSGDMKVGRLTSVGAVRVGEDVFRRELI